MTPEVAANSIAAFIGSFGPEGRSIETEKRTNILAHLEAMSDKLSCETNEVDMILISDGYEFTALADAYKIAETGRGDLPILEFSIFKKCHLHIWGFGYGADPVRMHNLKRAWFKWAQSSGFSGKPKLLNDW